MLEVAHVLVGEPVPTSPEHALAFFLSMIFDENRDPLFGIML
jgi:hypothetical protein